MADRLFFVSLQGLPGGRHHFDLTEAGASLELPADDLVVETDVHLDLDLDRSGTILIARGNVTAEAVMTCSRCLESFRSGMSPQFEVVIRMNEEKYHLEDDEDPPVDFIDEGVSFAASVRESIILAVPMKPLCDDGCSGLCQKCGANLNQSSCDCPQEAADPRWDGLKILSEET
ncbi:DUF177 domain-containing protein [Candidatus Zixiibacteriota bacterium]